MKQGRLLIPCLGLLLTQKVWGSPLFTTCPGAGHACWSSRTSGGESNSATTNSAELFQGSCPFSRSWDIKTGDSGTNRSGFNCWLVGSLMEPFQSLWASVFSLVQWVWGSLPQSDVALNEITFCEKCLTHCLIHRRCLKSGGHCHHLPRRRMQSHGKCWFYFSTNQIPEAQHRRFQGQGHLRLWQKPCPWGLAINPQQLRAELTEARLERKRSRSLFFPPSLLPSFPSSPPCSLSIPIQWKGCITPRTLLWQKPVTSFVRSWTYRWMQPAASRCIQDVFICPPRTPAKCFWQKPEERIKIKYKALHS